MHAKENWFLFSASRCRTDAAFCHPCDLWAIHLVTYCRSPTMIYGLAISADRLADCRNCDVHEDTVGDGAHAHTLQQSLFGHSANVPAAIVTPARYGSGVL